MADLADRWPTPVHTHDCSECVFVGTFRHKYTGGLVDLYVMAHTDELSYYNIRTDSDGPEYITTNEPENYLAGFERSKP